MAFEKTHVFTGQLQTAWLMETLYRLSFGLGLPFKRRSKKTKQKKPRLCSQWEEVSGLDEENNSVRTYQICQTDSSFSHWLRSGFIPRRGASQVYVELRFTMMECSSGNSHHRSCKETFNLYYYQADSNEATDTYPPWMENPYTKVCGRLCSECRCGSGSGRVLRYGLEKEKKKKKGSRDNSKGRGLYFHSFWVE